jgi:hypothetical protein
MQSGSTNMQRGIESSPKGKSGTPEAKEQVTRSPGRGAFDPKGIGWMKNGVTDSERGIESSSDGKSVSPKAKENVSRIFGRDVFEPDLAWVKSGIIDMQRGPEWSAEEEGIELFPALVAKEDARIGAKVVEREALFDRINRAMNTSDRNVAAEVSADYNRGGPRILRARLEDSHWPRDEDRLLYLRYVVEFNQRVSGGQVDRNAMFNSMVQYESGRVDIVIGRIPTASEKQQVKVLRARKTEELNRWEAEEELRKYLRMVDDILKEERLERDRSRMKIDLRSKPAYTHGAVVAGAAVASPFATVLPDVSLLLDFIPILGQMKGIAEAIIGYNITGEKLSTWERGLGLLLNVLPGARAVFRTGKRGIQRLAAAGVEAIRRGGRAEEVFRLAKVASTMTEAEIKAAIITGKMASAPEVRAVKNILNHVDAMQGFTKIQKPQAIVGDTNVIRSLDKAHSGGVLNAQDKRVVKALAGQDVQAAHNAAFEAAEGGGTQKAFEVAGPVKPTTRSERDAILFDLEKERVGSTKDQLIVRQVLLNSQAVTFATGDDKVISGLARLAGIDPSKLRGLKVAEYLRTVKGTDTFDVVIRGHRLTVKPIQ